MSKVCVVVFLKCLFLHDISIHVHVVDNIMYRGDICWPLKNKEACLFFLILVAEKKKNHRAKNPG